VAGMPNVLRADSIAGADDALVHVAVATAADLHRLLLELKRAGAARATTMLRLQAIKPPAPVPVRR
jgi:Lrp/AsnC family leucine-responsive transcriptional regulator